MKKFTIFSVAVVGAFTLSACSVSTTEINHINQAKLASGKTVFVGFRKAEIPWQCEKISFTSINWINTQTEGQFTMKGPYSLIEDKAIDYANAQHLSPDYIGILIPTGVSVANWDVGKSSATVIYYRCKHVTAN